MVVRPCSGATRWLVATARCEIDRDDGGASRSGRRGQDRTSSGPQRRTGPLHDDAGPRRGPRFERHVHRYSHTPYPDSAAANFTLIGRRYDLIPKTTAMPEDYELRHLDGRGKPQPPPAGPAGPCLVCGAEAKFMCSQCGPRTHYCSAECQTRDWPSHRETCAGRPGAGGASGEQELTGVDLDSPSGDRLLHDPAGLRPRGAAGAVDKEDAASIAGSVTGRTYTGRGNAAQVLNRKGRLIAESACAESARELTLRTGEWRNMFRRRKRANTTAAAPAVAAEEPVDDDEELPQTEEERIEELKFYIANIYLIIKPVICCILLAVLWVKLTNPPTQNFYAGLDQAPTVFGGGISSVVNGGGASSDPNAAAEQAGIILGMIVVVTVIILLLFKYNQMKVLYGIFGVIVLSLLGLFGYNLGSDLLTTYNGCLDYITFFIFLWNLCAVGLVVIFWKGPMLLQQIYLTVMSSKMAFALSNIPAITTWVLLSLLAVWDLIAVLCPFGPLRLLIESSRENQREIPALLYTAAVWVGMAHDPGREARRLSASGGSVEERSIHYASSRAELIDGRRVGAPAAGASGDVAEEGGAELPSVVHGEGNGTIGGEGQEEAEEEEESSGLKLGLGDFVFYSVLVARAALLDWVTTVSVLVAVMTGMNMTIFLLAIWHKALPALPISIAFGLLFYFVSSITLTPFVNTLLSLPTQLAVQPTDPSGLWVGMSGGAGFVHL
ncbi:Presenilin-2 [Irineochytrium annulatum]|nr:Presenilin-2 [Irineochytrium annulatum]